MEESLRITELPRLLHWLRVLEVEFNFVLLPLLELGFVLQLFGLDEVHVALPLPNVNDNGMLVSKPGQGYHMIVLIPGHICH